MNNTALKVAGVVFLLVAVFHLLRLIFRWEVMIAGVMVPGWVSLIAFLAAMALSVWMFKSLK